MKNIYDFECSQRDARVCLFGIPWDATTSYGKGTSGGPRAIFEASDQLDLSVVHRPGYVPKIFWAGISSEVESYNHAALKDLSPENVNPLSMNVNQAVYSQTMETLKARKIPGVVGGDHSSPFGAIQACSEEYEGLGILHIDAHADLRDSYQGFKHSHASIMRNVFELDRIQKIVQVGIRDFCEEERSFIETSSKKIETFFDADLKKYEFNGQSWANQSREIIDKLPNDVWISFDIDGLDPKYCPRTGTPVPGGLSFSQASFLIEALASSGRNIRGFDLCEVSVGNESAPPKTPFDEWDANVGMRMLYQLCVWADVSSSNSK